MASTRIKIPINGNNSQQQSTERLSDHLILTGELKIDQATQLVEQLLNIEARNIETNQFDKITLLINSPGGDLYAAWMICDIMDTLKTPIETFGLGQIASAGIIIFMNGTKGLRKATHNTQFMSHRYSIGIEATHADLIAQRHELDRTHDRIVNHYIKCTNLPKKKVENELLVEHNVWLDATQCKKYNICDVILPYDPKNTQKVK